MPTQAHLPLKRQVMQGWPACQMHWFSNNKNGLKWKQKTPKNKTLISHLPLVSLYLFFLAIVLSPWATSNTVMILTTTYVLVTPKSVSLGPSPPLWQVQTCIYNSQLEIPVTSNSKVLFLLTICFYSYIAYLVNDAAYCPNRNLGVILKYCHSLYVKSAIKFYVVSLILRNVSSLCINRHFLHLVYRPEGFSLIHMFIAFFY